MKLSKPFIIVFVTFFLVCAAWSAQGSDAVAQTLFPGENFFLKVTMKETVRLVLPPPSTSIWAYKIKSGDADGGLLTLQNSFHGYFSDSSGRIKNTTGAHRFADLAHSFGPVTPHIFFGYDNTKNNNDWKVGEDNKTRMMYGASIDYKVADAFSVIPVFTYYDWGNQPVVASRPEINKEWIGGLQFRFVF